MEVQSRLVGIYAVDATHGENAIFLVFQLGILLLRYVATAYRQFAPQNLYQEQPKTYAVCICTHTPYPYGYSIGMYEYTLSRRI